MTDTLHAVCVSCRATNRVPRDRAGKEINCGKCHQPLWGGAPESVDAAGFEAQFNNSDVPVVVDFWAPWCGPCRMMAPAFEQASKTLGSSARLIKVNTDEEQALGSRFGIRSIPTLAVFLRGREIARQAGAMPAGDLVRWVQSVLPANQA